MDFRWLGYVNAFVDPALQHYEPMRDAKLLLQRPEDRQPYEFLGPLTLNFLPDLTVPEAREYVKDFMRAMVTDIGMDGWMSDFGEWAPTDAVYRDRSDPMANHNTYSVQWHRLWREVMDELRPDGDFAVFSRAGWTGAHADAMIYWAGDQETNWDSYDGIGTVIPAMLNLGISGIPFVTHDIAGYSSFVAPYRSKELFQRWTELGAFSPIMRTHEGEHKEENWAWDADAETTEHFRRFALIHDALAPELEALAATAEVTSAPIVRHLMLEFPDDPTSRTTDDQFLIGDSLLVAPVLEEGAVMRAVYLPPGATWFDVWSGTPYAGGQTVAVPAPIGSPPVFSRDADRTDLRSIM